MEENASHDDSWKILKQDYCLAREGCADAKRRVMDFLRRLRPENSCDIFVSYRRTGGLDLARMLQLEMKCRGYNVFFDYNSLRSGQFDKEILKAIDSCKRFILILSEGCLDRCVNQDDWVRAEIVHAMRRGKKIVPMRRAGVGFRFPKDLPSEIAAIMKGPVVEWDPDDECLKDQIEDTWFRPCTDDLPRCLLDGKLDSSTEGIVSDYMQTGESLDHCVFRVFAEMIGREMEGGSHEGHSFRKDMSAASLFA